MKWLLLICYVACAFAQNCPNPSKYAENVQQVPLNRNAFSTGNTGYVEISGLAWSKQTHLGHDYFWANNDGNSHVEMGLFDLTTKELVHNIRWPSGFSLSDPESLSLGPCGDNFNKGTAGNDCIYFFEAGNNGARESHGASGRRDYKLYKIREPTISSLARGKTQVTVLKSSDVLVLPFTYPSTIKQYNDCESMFVDFAGIAAGESKGDIYITTKWPSGEKGFQAMYRYPIGKQTGSSFTLELVSRSAQLQANSWYTRGDMSRDGKLLALGSTTHTWFWSRNSGTTIAQMMEKAPCSRVAVAKSGQHEALTLAPDGNRMLEIAEGTAPMLVTGNLGMGGSTGPSPTPPPTPGTGTTTGRKSVPNNGACDWGLQAAGVKASCSVCKGYKDGRSGEDCVYVAAKGLCFPKGHADAQKWSYLCTGAAGGEMEYPCNSDLWSDVVQFFDGKPCKVQAETRAQPTCDAYCAAQGHKCKAAYKDEQAAGSDCNTNFKTAGSNNMFCECAELPVDEAAQAAAWEMSESGDDAPTGQVIGGASALAPSLLFAFLGLLAL